MSKLAATEGEAQQAAEIERMASPSLTVESIVLWLWLPPPARNGHDALHSLMTRIIASRHERLVGRAFALR
jgi:hypothetical protein